MYIINKTYDVIIILIVTCTLKIMVNVNTCISFFNNCLNNKLSKIIFTDLSNDFDWSWWVYESSQCLSTMDAPYNI